MMCRRKVLGGHLRVQGRTFRLPDAEGDVKYAAKLSEVEGQRVWVDDEGVHPTEIPKLGLYCVKEVPVYWPTRYDWLINARLVEGGAHV